MKYIRPFCLMLTAGLAFSVALVAPGSAQSTPVDCSKADSMMTSMSMAVMTPSGNLDKDFAQMMMAHNKAMMAAAKMEMACGTDPNTKAMAQQGWTQEAANAKKLQEILGGGH